VIWKCKVDNIKLTVTETCHIVYCCVRRNNKLPTAYKLLA